MGFPEQFSNRKSSQYYSQRFSQTCTIYNYIYITRVKNKVMLMSYHVNNSFIYKDKSRIRVQKDMNLHCMRAPYFFISVLLFLRVSYYFYEGPIFFTPPILIIQAINNSHIFLLCFPKND